MKFAQDRGRLKCWRLRETNRPVDDEAREIASLAHELFVRKAAEMSNNITVNGIPYKSWNARCGYYDTSFDDQEWIDYVDECLDNGFPPHSSIDADQDALGIDREPDVELSSKDIAMLRRHEVSDNKERGAWWRHRHFAGYGWKHLTRGLKQWDAHRIKTSQRVCYRVEKYFEQDQKRKAVGRTCSVIPVSAKYYNEFWADRAAYLESRHPKNCGHRKMRMERAKKVRIQKKVVKAQPNFTELLSLGKARLSILRRAKRELKNPESPRFRAFQAVKRDIVTVLYSECTGISWSERYNWGRRKAETLKSLSNEAHAIKMDGNILPEEL